MQHLKGGLWRSLRPEPNSQYAAIGTGISLHSTLQVHALHTCIINSYRYGLYTEGPTWQGCFYVVGNLSSNKVRINNAGCLRGSTSVCTLMSRCV
jgi:hypothetical protein